MADPRLALQHAFRKLIYAQNPEERRALATAFAQKFNFFMHAEPFTVVTADLEPLARRARDLAGSTQAPLTHMTDDELEELNTLLPWAAMTVDASARTVGQPYSPKKRNNPHDLIDGRQARFNEAFPLKGRHVLEMGCFEGIHTLGLLLLGAQVTAVDGRMENVLKTLARLWAYGQAADVRVWNVERPIKADMPESWDVLHHIGVLYHLTDPVEHLMQVLPRTRQAVLLDTHVASPETLAGERYVVGERAFSYSREPESMAALSPFAGMLDHAKYLLVEDLMGILKDHGFGDVRLVENRAERNGPRVLIWAFR